MPQPDHIVRRYLNGGCVAFAIALKRELGLPVYALVDRSGDVEEWPHVFVADEDGGFAVDVRGILDLDAATIAQGARVGEEISIRPVSIKDAQWKLDRHPTTPEINEARAVVRKYLAADVDNHRVSSGRAPG